MTDIMLPVLGPVLLNRMRNRDAAFTRAKLMYEIDRKSGPDAICVQLPFTLASTMKLFTTGLAFHRFGPTYQFSTDALRDGSVSSDGTLHGNIVLRGDGDPSLSGRFMDGGPNAPTTALAQRVAAAGIKRITGDVIHRRRHRLAVR